MPFYIVPYNHLSTLQVAPGSPGEAAGLEEFFDYVIAINGHRYVVPA